MLKYMFKVFDDQEVCIIQATVPADSMWSALEKFKELGKVKAYLLDDENE